MAMKFRAGEEMPHLTNAVSLSHELKVLQLLVGNAKEMLLESYVV
jgi:hypothetical protein